MDPVILESRPQMMLPSSLIEGRRATTHRFTSAQAPEDFLRELLAAWSANGQVHVHSRHEEWHIASTWRDGRIETVQVKPHPGGLEGLHTLWQPERSGVRLHAQSSDSGTQASQASDFPQAWLPPGVEILRRVMHEEGLRHLTTVVATSNRPLAELAHALRDRLGTAGFDVDPSATTPIQSAASYPPSSRPSTRPGLLMSETSALVALRRGDEELIATLSRHGERVGIVMHWGSRR